MQGLCLFMTETFITEIQIPRANAGVSAVQRYFKSIFTDLGFQQELCYHFELAIEEGLNSLFEYAMDENSKELLRIRIEFREDEIRVNMSVKGRPINVDTLSKYQSGEMTENADTEGLGLFLIQGVMDTVQWRYLEKHGQELFFAKRLPLPTDLEAKKYIGQTRSEAYGLIAPEMISNAEISFRQVESIEDAFAVTSCAYDLYNYNYKDVVYYPNELLHRNKNHLMHSWIAVDEKLNVYGHYAWIKRKPGDSIAEMGAAFVRPEYRRFGIFNGLAVGLHEDAYRNGLRGLFALSVTNITTTQKHSEAYGRYTVGVRISSSPAIFVDGAKEGERVSTVLNYKQLISRRAKGVYIHPYYREIVVDSYQTISLEIIEKEHHKNGNRFEEYFDNYRENDWSRALISARGGESIQKKLATITRVLVENGILSIVLSIDLEDSSAIELVDYARSIGFFYSGIFPESFFDGHDSIQLQYLNNITVDASVISIHQVSGRRIFDFIRKEVPHIFKT